MKKENNKKNYRSRELWMKRKKEGRPKQQWVKSTLNGEPLADFMTMEGIENVLTEASIRNYIPAHWEKTSE